MAAPSHGAGGQRQTPLAARRTRRTPRRLLRLLLLGALALLARPFARRPAGPPRKILYVKPDHLGDLLLATPALAALRQCFPEAQISALVGPWARAVLARNPDIDRLLTYPFPGFARAGDQRPTKDEGRRTNEPRLTTNDQRPTTNAGAQGRMESIAPAPSGSHSAGLASAATEGGVGGFPPASSGSHPAGPSSAGAMQFLNSPFSMLNSARPWWELLRYGLLLRNGGYDLAIIGRDDHWWGAALALLAGVPRRVGFAVPECRPFLSTALPWRPDDHVTIQGLALVEAVWTTKDEGRRTKASAQAPSPDSETSCPNLWGSAFHLRHLRSHLPGWRTKDKGRRTKDKQTPANDQRSTTNGASFSALNAQHSIPKARFDPDPSDLAWADEWLARQLAGAGRLVVIHPGTGGPAKLWTAERWAAVADALAARGDVRLLLTGGPGEEALVAAVRAGMHAPAPSLAGQTSLGQLAALLRQADLVLGVDSGPLHLAAAQGTPTVHLYGPGDERRFGPWGDPARHAVLRTALWCSPCGVFGACPRGLALPECMERIGTAAVLEAARATLGP